MKTRLGALALFVCNSPIVRSGLLRVCGANLHRGPASSVRTRLKSEAVAWLPDKWRACPGPNMTHRPANIINPTRLKLPP